MFDDKIIKKALELDMEVKWAKKESDVRVEGLHLLEPSYNQIINGLQTAMDVGVRTVVVHSKLTWSYFSTNK